MNAPSPVTLRLLSRLLGFLRFLREEGYRIGVQEEMDALRVAERTGLLEREQLRLALRALLCADAHDWHRFDELFHGYWRGPTRRGTLRSTAAGSAAPLAPGEGPPGAWGAAQDVDRAGEGSGADAGGDGTRGGASRQASVQRSDFGFITEPGAMAALEELVERLARRMRRRLVRRQRIRNRGRRIHLRRTLRKSLRYGGTPFELVYRKRRRELPRLLLLLDVSRSMSLYSLLLLRFARGLLGAFRDAEAFVFHTRLVHITEALRERDLHRVRERLALLSLGWSGGTRIGDCLAHFNREYGRRLLHHRTVVLVMSDGFDTGPPERLAAELGRIRERARAVVWLNPLLGREGYEPRAGGMQAALPLLDRFLPAHNLASLQALEQTLATL